MSNGWSESAGAWIAAMGEHGDWGREHVLDAVMLSRVEDRGFRCALDVGCGEGRLLSPVATAGRPSTSCLPHEKTWMPGSADKFTQSAQA